MSQAIPNQENLLHRITNRIRQSLELQEILTTAVQEIRSFLEVDRVKIYRFDADGSGEVVAESIQEQRLPSLLGLHFPANDIPAHAREMFIKTRQRVIVDVVAQRKIINQLDCPETGNTLTIPYIRYAPVDPCHVQYLQAMGVLSALSVPILHQNRLWGLLGVHHAQPHSFSERELSIVQLLVDQVSIAIAQSNLLAHARQQAHHEAIINRISNILHCPPQLSEVWQTVLEETVKALQGSGGRLYIVAESTDQPAQLYTWAEQPTQLLIEETPPWQKLLGWQQTSTARSYEQSGTDWDVSEPSLTSPDLFHQSSSGFGTRGVPTPYVISNFSQDPQLQFLAAACESTSIQSVVIIPLQYRHQHVGCLSIFRHGDDIDILWAGQLDADERNQQPRQSFEAWRETKTGQVQEWGQDEIKLAQSIGLHLYMTVMQKRVESLLRHQASHDSLTNLPNRMLFDELLSLALVNARHQGEMLAVAFLDLDRFKTVNDTLGHAVGDQLLQLVTQRLRGCLREGDAIARWGGDEFTLLFPRIHCTEDISNISQRILDILGTPFCLESQEFYITASLGIALAPYDGEEPETLLKNADTALYRAKQLGKNNYQLFSAEMHTIALEQLELEADLRKALERNEFLLHYQPQVDINTRKIVGMEALIRWQHPQLGLVSPNQFIPLAEETGLISPISEWVLRTACTQQTAWRKSGLPPIRIAVNLSARQFQHPGLVQTIVQILQETQMEPCYLEIEITESIAMQNTDFTIAVLRELQQMGIHITIDDFGTGYSSLSAIQQFPLHTLKIDQSFMRDVLRNPSDAAIAKAVVALGQGLNLRTLAEGVETLEQLQFLQSLECDYAQGFFFSQPVPAEVVVDWLATPQRTTLGDSLCLLTEDEQTDKVTSLARTAEAENWVSETEIVEHNQLEEILLRLKAFEAENRALNQEIIRCRQTEQALRQQAKREQLVTQISQTIRQSLNLEEILNTTVAEVRQFLATDRVILYRFEADWSGVVLVESVAAEWIPILGTVIEEPCFRDSYVQHYRQGRIRAIEDIHTAGLASCHINLLTRFQVKANLVVPILQGEHLWGLMIAHHCRGPRHWQQAEISLLNQLATQAAIAIQQAELYQQLTRANQELQRLATLDGLTQVANRRQFDQCLEQEWRRLARDQVSLSLILCDVDCFKLYNDTYGHQAGDSCLKQVARAIQRVAKRPADLVARYGGEEFAVILPNTPAEGAIQLAEAIRTRVKELGIVHASSPISDCVTLSLGVASIFPSPRTSPTLLVMTADKALYQAKAAGRDQVVFQQLGIRIQ